MVLKDKFKWYAVVAKDTALNINDAVFATVRAHKDIKQGNPEEAKREVDDMLAHIEARKAARNANKPSKPDSTSFLTMR